MIQLVLSKYVDFTVIQPEVSLNQLNWKSEVEMFGCAWNDPIKLRKWWFASGLSWKTWGSEFLNGEFRPWIRKQPGTYRL